MALNPLNSRFSVVPDSSLKLTNFSTDEQKNRKILHQHSNSLMGHDVSVNFVG